MVNIKHVNNKNQTNYSFKEMIRIKSLIPDSIKIDKKSYKT